MNKLQTLQLKQVKEYKRFKKLSALAWNILATLNDENRLLLGNPFVQVVDSIGANITKGYNQADEEEKIKFYINSKIALAEACDHWLELMLKRNVISKVTFLAVKEAEQYLKLSLNSSVSKAVKNKDNGKNGI